MTALLPDPDMMTEVIRLADAARTRGPAGPLVYQPGPFCLPSRVEGLR